MRQIYTSPRYENVERVVALLSAANIATTIRNRRDWQGGQWKRFSYTQRGESEGWAQVWVTDSNDQTRAREILREAGLEPATRFADELAAARDFIFLEDPLILYGEDAPVPVGDVAALFLARGHQDVRILQGGLAAWRRAGGPMDEAVPHE